MRAEPESAITGALALESCAGEPAPSLTPPPSIPSEADLDEREAMLRRAIEVVRGPIPRFRLASKITCGRRGPAAQPADSGLGDRSLTRRVVQIDRDPHEPAYVARDVKSGLSMLRHQDIGRLRAMCDRIGWQVVDSGSARLEG
jgi:hypothetical protein